MSRFVVKVHCLSCLDSDDDHGCDPHSLGFWATRAEAEAAAAADGGPVCWEYEVEEVPDVVVKWSAHCLSCGNRTGATVDPWESHTWLRCQRCWQERLRDISIAWEEVPSEAGDRQGEGPRVGGVGQ